MSNKIQTAIVHELDQLVEQSPLVINKRGDNQGPFLRDVYFWQEILSHAKEQLTDAWERLRTEKLIDDDDTLRETAGERIVTESNQFSCVVNVNEPRKSFSKEKFILAVAKKYKIDSHQLEKLAEANSFDGKAPLSKRVLEV